MKFLSLGFVALNAIAAVNGANPTPYELQKPPLDTPWTEKVGTNPWPEHPRPQLVRKDWKSLNGLWTWQATGDGDNSKPPTGALEREVLVPSCIESGLSGIQELNITDHWFQTTERLLLNFEPVDYEATGFVNGKKVGSNVGGYFRFTIDITDAAKRDGNNEL